MLNTILCKVLFTIFVFLMVSRIIKRERMLLKIAGVFGVCTFFELGVNICGIFYKIAGRNAILKAVFMNPVIKALLGNHTSAYYLPFYFGTATVLTMGLYYYKERDFVKVRRPLFLSLLMGLFFSLALSNRLSIEYIQVSLAEGYEALEGLRIVHISDLHNTKFPDGQKQLVEEIAKAKPDLIALTGDILDDRYDFQGSQLLLEAIQDLAPMYYVPGNHEYWSDYYFEMLAYLEGYGVTVLQDEGIELVFNNTAVAVYGFDDPDNFMHKPGAVSNTRRFDALAYQADDGQYNILLSHRPELVPLYEGSPFQLILCGHAHGGQVRVPFTDISLLAPNQGPFPKYTNGLYELEGGNRMVVSRGLSINANLPRVFNRPQLIIVTLGP